MRTNNLREYLENKDYKKIMLIGLISSAILVFAILAIAALLLGYSDIFYFKFLLALASGVLLVYYYRSDNTILSASILLLIVEIEGASAIFGAFFYDFVSIYPFFPVFGFFFFYRLKTAFWLTGLHILFWAFFAVVLYRFDPINPRYEMLSVVNMLATTFVVVLAGVIYHISTEITYQRLQHANTQKALLLQEIHHRIKNNLNKMSSALGLQMLRIHDEHCDDTKEILRKNKLRIEAMSMVHEALYRSEDISRIDAGDYTRRLLNLISQTYSYSISNKVISRSCTLPLEKALRLGTILNELYTNTIKYAHLDCSIEIVLTTSTEDRCHFIYTQIGPHTITDPKQLTKSSGLGMMLVKLSAREMGGELHISIEDKKLIFEIVFEMEE